MTRKFLSATLCAALTILLALPSCKKDSAEKIDLIPVRLSKDGNWSMMDKNGNIVYADEFKNRPTVSYNGFFFVEEGEGYTLYSSGGKKPSVVKDCENLKSVGLMEDGLIPVTRPNERITVIDGKGNKKFSLDPVKGREIKSCGMMFCDGMLRFTLDDGKTGFINTSGKVAVQPKYDGVGNFSEGLALVGVRDTVAGKEHISVIDKSGKTVFKFPETVHPVLPMCHAGYFLAANDDDVYYLLDKKGEKTKLPSKIKGVRDYNEDYIIYTNDDSEWGVMTIKGESVIRPKYKEISFAAEGNFIAKRSGSEGEVVLLDKKGEMKKTLDYEYVTYLEGYGYFGYDGSTTTLLNDKFKPKCKEDIYGTELDDIYEYGIFLPSVYGNVSSDYFNADGVAKEVVSLIGSNGVGKYTLGASPSQLLSGKDPGHYTYTSTTDLDDLSKTQGEWSLSATGLFTENLARYNYDYYSYTSSYNWNSSSHLGGISLEVRTESEFSERGFNAMKKALSAAGFKLSKEGVTEGNAYGALFTKGNLAVFVESPYKGYSCDIMVASTAIVPGIRTSIEDRIDSNGKIDKERSGTGARREYDMSEGVESAAVAEPYYGDSAVVEAVAEVEMAEPNY